ALRAALSDRLAGGGLTVVDRLALTEPKTKALVALLAGLGVGPGRTLLVAVEPSEALLRASRNLPWLRLVRPSQVSVVDVLRHERVIFERQALLALQEVLAS
ncbi:MAG: 50S ribosomal protein L4, partial [Candidatus Rokubacteria bacterium]|nr:50S ribosomal protein L4 [Candidatus Rokubacteria bacterium]